MSFFKQILETGLQNVIIEVKLDSTGDVTVVVTPKTISKDSALKSLKPIFITGPVEEVDSAFFEMVNSPLTKVASVISNAESYEKETEKVSKNTDAEKKKKDNIKKLQTELEKTVASLSTPEDWKKNKEKIETQIDSLSVADSGNKYAARIFGRLKENISKASSSGLFEMISSEEANDSNETQEVDFEEEIETEEEAEEQETEEENETEEE